MSRGDARDRFERFRRHFAAREFTQAAEAAIAIVEANPRDAQGWRNLGAAYMGMGHDDEAAEVLRRGLAIAPGDAYAHYNLGVVSSRKGRHEEAIACYEKALDLAPELEGAYEGLAASHFRLGDLDRAVHYYSRAYLLSPDSAEIARSFGVSLCRIGRPAKAVFYLRHASALKPRWVEPRIDLAEALRVMGSFREAMREVLRALRIKRTPAGLTLLARVYLERGKIDRALARARAALRIDPGHAAAHRVLGIAEARLHLWGEAVKSLEEALRLVPDDMDIVLDLANVLVESNRDVGKAHRMVLSVLARDPRNVRALDTLGFCLHRQGREREAAEALERARDLLERGGVVSESAVDVYRRLTEVYGALGDSMMAEDIWRHRPEAGPER